MTWPTSATGFVKGFAFAFMFLPFVGYAAGYRSVWFLATMVVMALAFLIWPYKDRFFGVDEEAILRD